MFFREFLNQFYKYIHVDIYTILSRILTCMKDVE